MVALMDYRAHPNTKIFRIKRLSIALLVILIFILMFLLHHLAKSYLKYEKPPTYNTLYFRDIVIG